MAAAVALSVLAGCGLGTRPVISTTWTRESATLHLAGTTDLPDGALVDYEVWSGVDGGDALDVTGTAQVRGGRFAADVQVTGPVPADIRARITFESGGDQPAAVTTLFGADGSGMSGPSIVDDDDGRRFQTTEPIIVGE